MVPIALRIISWKGRGYDSLDRLQESLTGSRDSTCFFATRLCEVGDVLQNLIG